MLLEGKFAMAKKMCWLIIFTTIALNVVLLQMTVEAYFGLEYHHVYTNTLISIISTVIALVVYFYWRKLEYSSKKSS